MFHSLKSQSSFVMQPPCLSPFTLYNINTNNSDSHYSQSIDQVLAQKYTTTNHNSILNQ